MNDTTEKQQEEQWAIVELFGHNKVAGKLSEQQMGGCAFVRVDVPDTDTGKGYTRLYGNGAIYSIAFVEEAIAREAARSYSDRPYIPLRFRPGNDAPQLTSQSYGED